MTRSYSEGFSAGLTVAVDFCPITHTVSADRIDFTFNSDEDLTITFSPKGLDTLIDRAVAARAEFRELQTAR
ncbi:hypothetical protein V5P93_006168 [Actinokineospora auranticolor]|uniref:Uncharacterized protein n=1 Tax=Actinokineospora auranticolor TaxID=155976 RepID=A0A2S6GHS6_9PSEU|nr:hypothetical protein [Actinokineospora auranticolor]PPK64765.1 hypothetical protein CLV40_1173 [Actinokineospora auranticolor]